MRLSGRPEGHCPRTKYKQLFGRNELKLCILDTLREEPADDEAIAKRIIERKGWNVDDALWADVLEWVRDANQRAQKEDGAGGAVLWAGWVFMAFT
jgi:hypothetical protein